MRPAGRLRVTALVLATWFGSTWATTGLAAREAEVFDVVVYGGTSAGVTAAVQAARMGKRVVLIEPLRHLGGMTSSGLGATDIGDEAAIGGLAREFYRRVRRAYDDPARWTAETLAEYRRTVYREGVDDDVMWYFEPHVAEEVFDAMLREAGATVVLGERLELDGGVTKQGSRIASIRMESGREFGGRVFLDTTYEGDLMAGAGVAYTVGRESNSVYGETLNGAQPDRFLYSAHNFCRPVDAYVRPGDPASGLLFGVQPGGPGVTGRGDRGVQAYCFRLCLTDVPENRVPFPKPDGYDPTRYELLLRHLTADGAFPDHPDPIVVEHPALGYNPYLKIMPNRKTDSNTKGALSFNLVGGNGDYPDGDHATRARILKEHEGWQKGLLWFLANDPRVPPEYREPMADWGLARDEFADNGHWPYVLYIREARRMVGAYVMTEHDCLGRHAADDPIGLAAYTMDSHTVRRYADARGHVHNEGTIGGRVPHPYPISYRATVPKAEECTNLLVPVCLSASHPAFGSIRMEPVFMVLGQSAATAASLAVDADVDVQRVPTDRLRERLEADGQVLAWDEAAGSRRPRPTADPRSLKVVCLGDSITKAGYPEALGSILGVEAINAGVGGQTSRAGLARLERDAIGRRPDAVVILFGTNDSRLDSAAGLSPGAYEANLRAMIARCHKAKIHVVVGTIPPIEAGPYFGRHVRAPFDARGGLDAVVAEYRAAAIRAAQSRRASLVDLNRLLADDPSWRSPDGVHPTDEGDRRIAALVARPLASLLRLPAPSADGPP